MNCLKNLWILMINLIIVLAGLTIFYLCQTNIPLIIDFKVPSTANYSIFYTTETGFGEVRTIELIGKKYISTSLPIDINKVEINTDSITEQLIVNIQIGNYKILKKPLFISKKHNKKDNIVDINNIQTIVKKWKNDVRAATILGILCFIFLLLLEEFFYRYKDKIIDLIIIFIKKYSFLKYFILSIFLFIFSFNFFTVFNQNFSIGLDNSWVYGINKLNILPQYLYGKDVIFTYGPLGFIFYTLPLGQNLFWATLLSLFKWVTVLGLLIFNVFKINKDFFLGKFIFLLFGIFVFYRTGEEWIWTLAVLLLILTLWFFEPKNKVFVSVISSLIGIFSILIFLMKFNAGLLVIIASLLIGLLIFLYERKSFPRFILSYSIGSLGTFSILFNIYFKTIPNFINWVKGSISISQGFNTSMSVFGPEIFTILALSVIIFYFVIICDFYKRDFKMFIALCLLAPFIFFAFKHGFVRQDGHMRSFFYTVPYLIGFLSFYVKKSDYKTFIKMFLIIVLTCGTYSLKMHNIRISPNPVYALSNIKFKQTHSLKDINKNIYAGVILPEKWLKSIGNDSIQILPWELSYVETNNLKGWQPNPVLQLYVAYNKYLDELSAKSFVSPKAPKYILLEFNSVDYKNMFLDCPATWNNIMANYSVLYLENNKLLLKKNSITKLKEFKNTSKQNITFNEWLKIPSNSKDYLYAQFNVKPSLLGKLTTLFFRGYPLSIEIKYKNGQTKVYRIIFDTLRNPVVINYIPQNISQLGELINNQLPKTAEVYEIKIINTTPLLYKSKVVVNWYKTKD